MMKRTLLDWLFLEQELVEDLKELESSIENDNIAREVEGRELMTSTEPYRKIIKNLAEVVQTCIKITGRRLGFFEDWIEINDRFGDYRFEDLSELICFRNDDNSYELIYESIMMKEVENPEMPDSPLFEETLWTSKKTQAFFPNLYGQLEEMINSVKPKSGSVPVGVIGYVGQPSEDKYDWPFLNLFLKYIADEITTDLNKYLSIKTKQWLVEHITEEHSHYWMYYYLSRSLKKIYMREAIKYERGEWRDPNSRKY